MGAISTPVGTPAAANFSIALRRLMGLGVCGSVRFHTVSSTVPMLKLTVQQPSSASSTRMSRSLVTRVPLVVMETGLRKSLSRPRIRLVSSYFCSAGS